MHVSGRSCDICYCNSFHTILDPYICWLGREETPAERAHGMFTLLGLRHLVVVNEASHVRGIITRRDLDHAAGHGSWRRNKIADGPDKPEPQGAGKSGLC